MKACVLDCGLDGRAGWSVWGGRLKQETSGYGWGPNPHMNLVIWQGLGLCSLNLHFLKIPMCYFKIIWNTYFKRFSGLGFMGSRKGRHTYISHPTEERSWCLPPHWKKKIYCSSEMLKTLEKGLLYKDAKVRGGGLRLWLCILNSPGLTGTDLHRC